MDSPSLALPGPEQEEQPSSLNVHYVLLVLFKHKWKILLCAAIGFAAAAAFYFYDSPLYECQAKLMVRYVVDRSADDPGTAGSEKAGSEKYNNANLNSEVEILTSSDLAAQVAEALAADNLSRRAGKALSAETITSGLTVGPLPGSNVISVSYLDPDPNVAIRVLDELVKRYFVRHLEVHRSAGAFDFVSQQTDQLRARLTQTEEELRRLKTKAGILSLNDSMAAYSAEMTKSQDQLHAAEQELAEQEARMKEMEKSLSNSDTSPGFRPSPAPVGKTKAGAAVNQPTHRDIQQYQALLERLTQLRKADLELLYKYTPENQFVKMNEEEIDSLESQQHDMENKFPGLVGTAASPENGFVPENVRLAGIEAKTDLLKARVAATKEQLENFSEITLQISRLERQKALEETNFKYFQASLEKARIDEALDPSKIPNISIVQKPSFLGVSTKKRDKVLLGLAGGGLAFGIALALLIELVMDRTVRRPFELETQLGMPLLLSIPDITHNGYLPSHPQNGNSPAISRKSAHLDSAPWDAGHFIRSYAEAIRDRLILYFEIHKMKHKPKLVAVTGFSEGKGISTIAGGLAAALSETGDGKVLLVDLNAGAPAMQRFVDGEPARSISEALDSDGDMAPVADNLYLATANPANGGPSRFIPKRFYDMVPQFKASDFDYIIFDMPPVDQGSTTLAVAGHMDKVLLVIEAGKSNRDVVSRAYGELVAAKANVSCVFNKTRSYGPKWLHD